MTNETPGNDPIDIEYDIEYPNYKMEMRDRKIGYYNSSKIGQLKYQRVPMCGHSFVPQREPRHTNCESCWFAFFQVHGELTQSVEQLYQTNPEILLRLKGKKFISNFLKFMSTVAAFQASAQAAQAAQEKTQNVLSTGPVESSNEERTESRAERLERLTKGAETVFAGTSANGSEPQATV